MGAADRGRVSISSVPDAAPTRVSTRTSASVLPSASTPAGSAGDSRARIPRTGEREQSGHRVRAQHRRQDRILGTHEPDRRTRRRTAEPARGRAGGADAGRVGRRRGVVGRCGSGPGSARIDAPPKGISRRNSGRQRRSAGLGACVGHVVRTIRAHCRTGVAHCRRHRPPYPAPQRAAHPRPTAGPARGRDRQRERHGRDDGTAVRRQRSARGTRRAPGRGGRPGACSRTSTASTTATPKRRRPH